MDEYDALVSAVLKKYIMCLMAQHPILSGIKITESVHSGGMLYMNKDADLKAPLNRLSSETSITHDAIYNFNIEDVCSSIYEFAESFCVNMEKELFSTIGTITEFTGNKVDANGKAFNYESLLEAIEKIEIDFDESGSPKWPSMVMHPNTRVDFSSDALNIYKPKFDEIIARKKELYYAKKGRRGLSRVN